MSNRKTQTVEDVKETLANIKKADARQAMIVAMVKHGNITPEAYRYLEGFKRECPRCGLLNGHRYPCI